MSYHAIENLVEDAVVLLEQTDASALEHRRFVYNLYQFQQKFDCSYTTLRCFPFLERIAYIKKIPVQQHPDYESYTDYFKNLQDSDWLYTDVALGNESDPAYYENGFIFPEYGSPFWRRWMKEGNWEEASEEPQQMLVTTLMADLIVLAQKQGNMPLMQNLYLAFLNAYLEYDIDAEDGIPKKFEDWVNNPDLLRLRELFVQHTLLKVNKKETDFKVPSLSTELRLDASPDRQAKVHFLMNPKKTVDQIYGVYLKSQKALAELPLKIDTIGDIARHTMENEGWTLESATEVVELKTYQWIWYRDVLIGNYPSRIFTEIILEVELSSVLARQHIQHGLLLEWQRKQLSKNIIDAHFGTNPFDFLQDEEIEKHFNFLGLWVLPLKSKQNVIVKSFTKFLQHLLPLDKSYLHKIHVEFPEKFFSRPYPSYIDFFESSEPVLDFLLIANLYSISLLFMHRLVMEGKLKEALEINDILEERLTERFREGILWYKEHYVPYIQWIKNGQKPAMPELFKKNTD